MATPDPPNPPAPDLGDKRVRVKLPPSYRCRKWLRKRWNSLFDTANAVEAEDWTDVIVLHVHGEQTTTISQCPICAALVLHDNRSYHHSWHTGGSV